MGRSADILPPLRHMRRRSASLVASNWKVWLAAAIAALLSCHLALAAELSLDPRIEESSGVVHSRRYPGVLWVHADSNHPSELFAINLKGEIIRRFSVRGVPNVDWEDIAIDDAGNLYVGDIGNNLSDRRDLSVLRLREPNPHEASKVLHVDRMIPFRYPDQTFGRDASPDFDAESLYWANGSLYLLTKHRSDFYTTLYRFPSLSGSGVVVLERISEFDLGGRWSRFGGMATAADVSPDGKTLAVLTYHALFLFDVPETGHDFLSGFRKRIEFNQWHTLQCEALTWDGRAIVFTNEGGAVFRLDDPLGQTHHRFPGG
ncbi:MAG: hypothetical protein V3V08_02650 [Nannocystaceae bacterium]